MKSFLLRWLVRLVYLGVLIAILATTGYLSFNAFVRRGALTAPDVIGLELDESAELLAAQGLEMRHLDGEDRFDDEVPAGRVVQQRPPAASRVKRGAEIRVVLSRGKQLATVPQLEGKALQAALTELSAAGLQLGRRSSVLWNASEPGTVVHQVPAAGTEMDRSRPVDVLVAADDPDDTFVMPDLVDRSADAIRPLFESRGFRFGSIKYEPYEGVEPGTVLRHTPLAGHPLRRRDAISLVVATQPEADA